MAVIVIDVGGTDVTDDVIYESANFTMGCNGVPGSFEMVVKDLNRTYDFVVGSIVTVTVDGDYVFSGYLQLLSHTLFFPVEDTTVLDRVGRRWLLRGTDINVLFEKRIVFSSTHPTTIPEYAEDTTDSFIIHDIFDNYLDLSGDSLTDNSVTGIESPMPDEGGVVWNAGDTWGDAMRQIAYLPGGLFSLRPNRDLYYSDSGVENSPFDLSDQPSVDAGSVGYTNFEYTDDGTNLVNDAIALGVGTGSPNPVYSRTQDAASITAHGRWQIGLFRQDIYKQATINKLSNRIVYGSTQNRHAGKDDEIFISCRILQGGLLPGMNVRFINHVFGLNIVLPLRSLTVLFPTKSEVFYDLKLSWEHDAPWSWSDPLPDIDIPGIIPETWEPPEPGCEELCGITDTFDRTTTNGWGVAASSGIPYEDWWEFVGDVYSPELDASVNPGYGRLRNERTPPNAGGNYNYVYLEGPNWGSTRTATGKFKIVAQDLAASDTGGWYFSFGGTNQGYWYYQFNGAETAFNCGRTSGSNIRVVVDPLTTNVWYQWRFETSVDGVRVRVWPDGSTEPASWTVESVTTYQSTYAPGIFIDQYISGHNCGPLEVLWADLDIEGWTSCQEHFDDFNRNVSNGFGTSTSGLNWGANYSYTKLGVSDDSATFTLVNSAFLQHAYAKISVDENAQVPWNQGLYTMRMQFRVSQVPDYTFSRYFGMYVAVNYFAADPDSGPGIGVQVSSGTNGYFWTGWENQYQSLDDTISFSFTTQTYQLLWECLPGSYTRGKLWVEGSNEPENWMVDLDITGSSPLIGIPTELGIDFWGRNNQTSVLYIDYIDFDYEGKPCGWMLCPLFDDFSRTVSSGWSTASSGYVWESGQIRGDTYVSGGSGYLKCLGTIATAWSRVLDLPYSLPVEYTLFISATNWPSYDGIYHPNITVIVGQNSSGQVSVYQSLNKLEISNFGTAQSSTGHTFTSPFYLKIRLEQSQIMAKTWSISSSEPSSWSVTATGDTETVAMIECRIAGNSVSDPDFAAAFDFIDILEVNGQCGEVTGRTGVIDPGAPGAIGCEIAERITSTTYQTSAEYLGGTTEVWVDGIKQRLNIDYAESSTNHRLILFAEALSLSSYVQICYRKQRAV